MNFSKPNITEAEVAAVANAIRDGHLATGKLVTEFEEAFCKRFKYPFAIACNSGTTALTLALMALGVGPGDEVVVTSYSIMATANCILAVGATPVFCDVHRDTYNMDAASLGRMITERTKAIIPASIFGVPSDIEAIRLIADGIPIVEDTIESLGSTRAGKEIGLGADIATFGFYPNKQITTGQGGMLVTKDAALADKMLRLRQHGYGAAASLWNQGYGWNVRLPDPLAAMGIVQLHRLGEMQDRLREVVDMYDHYFKPFRKQKLTPGDTGTHFIYGIEIPDGRLDKLGFCLEMEKNGVPVRPYFNALHTVDHVSKFRADAPVAEIVGSKTIALPFHSEITEDEVEQVWDTFQGVANS